MGLSLRSHPPSGRYNGTPMDDDEDFAAEEGPLGEAEPSASEPPQSDRGFYRRIGEYTSLAFVIPAAMLVGFFGGRWLGGVLGGPGIGSAVGLVFGTGAAFLSLYHSLRRLERLSASDDSPAATKRRGR